MAKKVINLESDLNNIKALFGGGKKKSAKQLYEERLKEMAKEKEEMFYRMKLETLDKIEYKKDKLGKVKRKLKELLE